MLHGPAANVHGRPAAVRRRSCTTPLYASKICSYAQGFQLLRAAAAEYKWDLNFGEIAMIWRGGCIIRAQFLGRIKEAFDRKPDAGQPAAGPVLQEGRAARRRAPGATWSRRRSSLGIPVPAIGTALAYYDATAASGCRPTCSRPSATTSARTPTSASTSRAASSSTPTGPARGGKTSASTYTV